MQLTSAVTLHLTTGRELLKKIDYTSINPPASHVQQAPYLDGGVQQQVLAAGDGFGSTYTDENGGGQ